MPLEARSVEQQDTQPPQERQVEQFPVLTGLRKYALGEEREHVLLAGRPGSGKSTALKQLAVALAEEGQVPVLVQLKGDRTVPELIQSEFRRAKQRVTLEQIEDWLLADRLILLLDGVNEIPNDDLRRGLAQFREDNPTVPMVFTTRELAVGGDLGIDKRLEMKPLSESQMREFVQKYLPEHGEQLLGQLRDRLRELAETPLFLKMLCDVFKQTREIPQNKGELFRQFDRNYERLKKDYAPVSKNFWEFKSEVLQHLAFSMIQADVQKPTDLWLTISKKRAESLLENWLNQRGVVDAPTKAKEWLRDLYNHHLLQDAAKPGEIEFHHQLFQEYYAAEYLLQLLPNLSDEQLKRDYLNYLKWTEAIALMLALVEEETLALRVVKLALYVDLRLGAKLAGEVHSAVQQQAIETINMLETPEWLKVELLGITQSELVIPFLLQAIENEDLDITQSAVTWLTNIGGRLAIYHLRQKLCNLNNLFQEQKVFSLPDPKTGLWVQIIKSLSILAPADAILELRKKVLSSNFLTIFSSSEPETLLVKLDGINLAPKLFEIVDHQDCSNSRRRAVDLLGMIVNESVANKLIQALENETDSFVREGIIDALGNHCAKNTTMALIKNLGDQNHKIRRKTIENLVKQNSLIVIEELRKMLHHPNWEVGWCAAITLGMLHNHEAFSKLCEGLENSNKNIRRTAADVLGELGDQEAIPLLIDALQDVDYSVRRSAAIALGKFGLAEATSELAKTVKYYYLLGEENKHIQTSITLFNETIIIPGITEQELSSLGDDNAIQQWLYERRLSIESQIEVAEALRKIANEEAMKILFKFKDSGSQAALLILAEIGREEVIPALFEALISPEHKLTNRIINALASLSNDWIVEKLLSVLQNLDIYPRAEPYLCNRAAIVLCKIRVELTKKYLKDLNSLIIKGGRKQILWAISEIQHNCKYYNHEIAHGLIPQGRAIALFFSYVSKDEALQNELEKHLSILKREGIITSWDSRQILPGDEREQVISQQLNTADIILLLISSDSIADDTCYDLEIRRAMERHQAGEAHVIPILLRSVDWAGAPFSQLPVLPKDKRPVTIWDNQDEAFWEIAEEIRAVAFELRRVMG
ncbi:MAG: TIR domain-containing protein [Leptolyngbyaceae cyanobacterium SM1_4_3]|nr:TIR domain-containing protein [Leptolyngbyaceae cyanobacterium SM1_4_3]